MSKERQPTANRVADRVEAVLDGLATDDIALTTSVPDDLTVVTDAEILATVLRSPLENAVTYADSSVTVTAEATESGCTI